MDLNRDGVLAASSARKLDKAGYSLQERTALVAPKESVCGGLDLAGALSTGCHNVVFFFCFFWSLFVTKKPSKTIKNHQKTRQKTYFFSNA